MKSILVVDDEVKILDVVRSMLESIGFTVFAAETGRQALEIFEHEDIALVLLDLMLPDISGEEICTAIRKKSRVPVIMLTAKAQEADMLKGLDTGADDYITKPFSLKVLRARVEAVLRRAGDEPQPLFNTISYNSGELEINFSSRAVYKKGAALKLTPNEFKILTALVKYPGKIFTRDELIELALGMGFDGYDRAVDSHIKNLRQKIENDPKNPAYILTIRSIGYKFGGDSA